MSPVAVSLLDAPRSSARAHLVDLMRTVLALWVVLAHLAGRDRVPGAMEAARRTLHNVFQPAYETHPAVLVFIVLSGYCIHRSGVRSAAGIPAYGTRRAFRILPVFVLAALLGAAVAHLGFIAGQQFSLVGFAAKLLGVSGFWAPWNAATYQGNAPLHTVMVEIWLYVVYALVILLLSRGLREPHLWGAFFTVWFAGVMYCRDNPDLTNWWHNGSVFGFLIYWWIGAWFVANRIPRKGVIGLLGVWLMLTFILRAGMTAELFVVEFRKLIFAAIAGTLIAQVDRPVAWNLGVAGLAGYSLYAFHIPILHTGIALGLPWFITLIAICAVGGLAYVLIERPGTSLGKTVAAEQNRRPVAPRTA